MKSNVFLGLIILIQFFGNTCYSKKVDNKPNVIFSLVDDMGWKDAGCYGSSFYETPAIDQLAAEGLRFTNAYSAHPVCGPSRASILSGKVPLRLGNTATTGDLPASEKTIAETMKEAGYCTFFAGKWHVGTTEGKDPLHQGFDYAIGTSLHGQPGSYFYPYKDTGCDWPGKKRRVIPQRDVKGLEDGKQGEYLTDRLTDETIKFIEQHKEKPFFVYLSHYALHTPLEGKQKFIDHYRRKNKENGESDEAVLTEIEKRAWLRTNLSNPIYAAMVKSLDESLGNLMAKLDELGLSDNTIIVFTSDNGGVSTLRWKEQNIPTTNIPLKYGKGWAYEGGIRVPAIIKYPKKIKAGSTSDYPICHYDYYSTILALSGLPMNQEQHIDGLSLVPVINGEKPLDRKMYWYYPHNHGSGQVPSAAIRDGQFKLIWYLKDDRIELYNLKKDISEANDLSSEFPEKADDMKYQLSTWINNTKPNK